MLIIRPAKAEELPLLSRLASEDRAHWAMNIDQLEGLRDSLDPALLPQRPTFVVNLQNEVAGFYQLRLDAEPAHFERFWVRPARASLGVAALMWGHARDFARRHGVVGLQLEGSSDAERLRDDLLRVTAAAPAEAHHITSTLRGAKCP
jgi:GNAT superfamily N-acetyltransferase